MKALKAILAAAFALFLMITPITPALAAECRGEDVALMVVHDSSGNTLYANEEIPWIEGETVRLAMMNAAEISDFQFKTEFDCPFGDYVTEIMGIPAPEGQYWGLFVNWQLSEKGIDTAILDRPALIDWELLPIGYRHGSFPIGPEYNPYKS